MKGNNHIIALKRVIKMKSLKTIQVLAKIARIICLILFVTSIIGVVGSTIAIISYPYVQDVIVSEGKTVAQLLSEKGLGIKHVYFSLATSLAGCGLNVFLAKYTEVFFKKELEIGTPFHTGIVKSMRKMALVHIISSIAFAVAVGIAVAFMEVFGGVKINIEYSNLSTIGFGLSFLVLSLFCQYGAEVQVKRE